MRWALLKLTKDLVITSRAMMYIITHLDWVYTHWASMALHEACTNIIATRKLVVAIYTVQYAITHLMKWNAVGIMTFESVCTLNPWTVLKMASVSTKSQVIQIVIIVHAQHVHIIAFWVIQSTWDMTKAVACIAKPIELYVQRMALILCFIAGAVRDQVIDIRMAYAKAR